MAIRALFIALAMLSLVASASAELPPPTCQGGDFSYPNSTCASLVDRTACCDCVKDAATNKDYWKCAQCFSASDKPGCYGCVKAATGGEASKCSVCFAAQDTTKCYACVAPKTAADAWACQACTGLTAGTPASDACYTCANSAAPGWYCQRLVQTPLCLTAAPTNTATDGCLGCMTVAGGNNVEACFSCANSFTTADGKQACMRCVEANKNAGGAAYSCPARVQACTSAYGAGYETACSTCLVQFGLTTSLTDDMFKECVLCKKSGKAAKCATEVTWTFNINTQPQFFKVNDVIRLKWTSSTTKHNVYETKSADVSVCPTAEDGIAPSNLVAPIKTPAISGPSDSGPILLSAVGNRYFVCTYGAGVGTSGQTTGHCAGGGMRLKITVSP